jgi:hypothetical protein
MSKMKQTHAYIYPEDRTLCGLPILQGRIALARTVRLATCPTCRARADAALLAWIDLAQHENREEV